MYQSNTKDCIYLRITQNLLVSHYFLPFTEKVKYHLTCKFCKPSFKLLIGLALGPSAMVKAWAKAYH